jgi:transposase
VVEVDHFYVIISAPSGSLLYYQIHQPIYDAMKVELLKQTIIHADETSVQVLAEEGKKAESQSFMWLYRSGRYGPGIVLYEYQPSRAREHPLKFLNGFKGYLASDGYAGYNGIPDVINVGCWAHCRRGFDEAGKGAKNSKAIKGLKFCNQLYAIERELATCQPEKRYEERLRRSKPVLEAFLAWLRVTYEICVPESHLGKAIQYCLNQWESLNNFLLDGRLEIDNNRAERSIKPFVIGRKNFLFCITPRGANASAVTYSVIESAKENGLKPNEYLEYLLERLPNATSQDLAKFLPWSEEIPEYCRTLKKK